MYTARQLSFAGVKFSINEVPLSADFVDMYNASVKLVSNYLHILLSFSPFPFLSSPSPLFPPPSHPLISFLHFPPLTPHSHWATIPFHASPFLLLSPSLQWVEARKLFQEASDLMDFDRKKLKPMWSQFWAAHQVRTKLNLHEVLGYELFSISKKKDFYREFIRYISI